MELNQSIDPVFSCHLYSVPHQLKIGLIKFSLFWLYSRPHHSQSDTVNAFGLKEFHVILIECSMIGWHFWDYVQAMENQLSSSIIDEPAISYMNGSLNDDS